MFLKIKFAAVFALLPALAAGGCQTAGGTAPATRVALAARPFKLVHVYFLNPDCTSGGRIEIQVTSPPAHGRVAIHPATGYTVYPKANPRSQCNDRPTRGVDVIYTPSRGYDGPDSVEFRGIGPDGSLHLHRYDVLVKQ